MLRRIVTASIASAIACPGVADVLAVPRLPEPATVGMEVSTNIAFVSTRSDLRELEIRMEFSGAASNCVQMAFGRDADGDGVLAPEEEAFAMGWRSGRYFIEDASGGLRMEEVSELQAGSGRSLALHVSYGGDSEVKAATVVDESDRARFAAVLAAHPGWLLGTDWDLCRITRRGADSPFELFRFSRGYGCFHVFLK